MSCMLFKKKKKKANVANQHEPRGHLRRIINGQKEKTRTAQYAKPMKGPKEPNLVVKHFGSLLRGVIKKDSIVLGCIQEIGENTMIVSIPSGLGIVDVTRVSDAYNEQIKLFLSATNNAESTVPLSELGEMFMPGDILACTVIDRNTMQEYPTCDWLLSINPKHVNPNLQRWTVQKKMILNCAVLSIEDHGYMMDTGCSGVHGFLPFGDAEKFLETRTNRKQLSIGQVVSCAMLIPDTQDPNKPIGIVMLTVDPEKVAHAQIKRSCFSSEKLHLIPPGNRLKAVVQTTGQKGIVLRIKNCKVFVPRLHLVNRWDSPEHYEVGTPVHGKVLLFHMESETLIVTLRSSLVKNEKRVAMLDIPCGTIVKKAKVIALELGLTHFKLSPDVRGIATKLHLGDEKVELKFKKKCRVLSHNALDDTVIVTLQKNLLENKYLSINELKCGDIVTGTVSEEFEGRIIVGVSEDVVGFVKLTPLRYTSVEQTCSRYVPARPFQGQELTCRVLSLQPKSNSLELTFDPILVNSKLPIISGYKDVEAGLTTHGVIVGLEQYVAEISFYNGIKTNVDLTSEIPRGKLISCYLNIGDVVTCVVNNCDPFQRILEVSINLKDKSGEFHECTVVRAHAHGLEVVISGDEDQKWHFLPRFQLSDNYKLGEMLLKTYKPGDRIKGIVSVDNNTVSRKKSLVQWYETHDPMKFEDYVVGSVFPCQNLHHNGSELVAVLPGGFFAFSSKETNASRYARAKGTLFVQISYISPESCRIEFEILSEMKMPVSVSVNFTRSYLIDLFRIHRLTFGAMSIGDIVEFTSTRRKKDFVEGFVNMMKAIVDNEHVEEMALTSSEAVIIGFTPSIGCVKVSLRRKFVKLLLPCKDGEELQPKAQYTCSCLLVKPEFILVAVHGKYRQKLVYIPGRRYGDIKMVGAPVCQVGSRFQVSIKQVKKGYSIGTFVKNSFDTSKNTRKITKRPLEELSQKKSVKKLKINGDM